MEFLTNLAVFLAAAAVAVPLSRKLGLGSVLGYLVAGIALGPYGFGAFYEVGPLFHFAEFGVVLLLFVVGLELSPKRLWTLRKGVFGAGAAQVGLTGAALTGLALLFGLAWPAAVIVGFALALSSTAFGLQTLSERGELAEPYGRAGFGILLFQDIMVVPLLVVVPLLGATDIGEHFSLLAVLKGIGAVALVIIAGRYLLHYALRALARAGQQEVMTIAALLVVAGTALLMDAVGLSMALGAFAAGVLLAESEFRHELEADIEPFKGLLLGLFFFAIGMTIDLAAMAEQPFHVLGLVAALLAVKIPVLFAVGRVFGLTGIQALRLGALLSQGGEFAFVILTLAAGHALFGAETTSLIVAAVALSMAATPLLMLGVDRLAPRFSAPAAGKPFETPERGAEIVIAGFGRVGQIAARILTAKGIRYTALENSPAQVDFVKKFGNKVYYGDPTRLSLLRAAGLGNAKVFILAIDNVKDSLKTAGLVRQHFPDVRIFARAHDRKHAYQLMDLGVHFVVRETLHSSLVLAEHALQGLGLDPDEAHLAVKTFREHDEERLKRDQAHHSDEERMVYLAKKAAEELKDLFEQEARARRGKKG